MGILDPQIKPLKKPFPMIKAVLMTAGGLVIIAIFLFFILEEKVPTHRGEEVEIIKTWELPEILMEVSGIVYLGDNLMACIQDEDGIIFIYDLENKKIVKEINFAGGGDYEAITLVENTAYVLRSDGTIFEVRNFLDDTLETIEHPTPEKSKRNFEGLEYDEKNNKLLLALKERSGQEYRPIFSFDLSANQLEKEPVFRIKFSDSIFSDLGKNPSEKFIRPSEITIHPQTNQIYILEGVKPKILILNENGIPEKMHLLNKKQFRQAEGLTFGEKGEIYISNEGNGAPPNILQISLN